MSMMAPFLIINDFLPIKPYGFASSMTNISLKLNTPARKVVAQHDPE